MKRLLLLILLLVALTLPALAQVRVGLPSSIRNGDFEIDTDGNGQPDSWGQVRIQAGIDGLLCGKGAYAGCSYRMVSTGVSKWLVQGITFYVPRSTPISISGYLRTTTTNARMLIVFYRNGAVVEVATVIPNPASTYLSYTLSRQFPVPIDRVVVHLGLIGAGEASFDRMSISR